MASVDSTNNYQCSVTEQKIEKIYTYDWKIKNYSFVIKPTGDWISSPKFFIGSGTTDWYLYAYPNGHHKPAFSDGLCIILESPACSNTFIGMCVLSLINNKGKQFVLKRELMDEGTMTLKSFIKHSLLTDKAHVLLPNDCLTIRCEFFKMGKIIDSSSNFNEKIQNPFEKLSPFARLFLRENLSNVKLIASCGKSLPAHKSILAYRSPVFMSIFIKDMLEKENDEVKFENVKYAVLKEMLRFIYVGEVENVETHGAELIQLADKYKMSKLRRFCEKELIKIISIDNVIDILVIAHQDGNDRLKKKAIKFIEANMAKIIISDKFQLIKNDDEVVKCILEVAMSECEGEFKKLNLIK